MALSISPSPFWGGNNGNWSTIRLVLSPSNPQILNVFPSFLTSQIWVPTAQGCTDRAVLGTVSASQCASRRGGVYNATASREATTHGVAALPVSGRPAVFGSDNASFGALAVGRQIVAGFTTLQPFLGSVGLSAVPTTLPWDTPDNATRVGILSDLWQRGRIASRVWGCNVGASYRHTAASVTLGGYDASRGNRFDEHGRGGGGAPGDGGGGGVLTVPMNADRAVTDGDLLVEIRGVGIGADAQPQPGLPVTAVVDSLMPDLFLPDATCAYFEREFGLSWDGASRRYFVNETQHERLLALDKTVRIAVGIPGGGGGGEDGDRQTTITLPYAAFDLQVSWPLNGITGPEGRKRYFPLQRASPPYYLGRAFLQEVYLAADYERRQFNVSQARWPTDGKADIRVVTSSSNTTAVATPAAAGEKASELGGGAVTGVALGVVGALAIVGLVWWFLRKRRRADASQTARVISRPNNIGSSLFGPPPSMPPAGTRVEEETPALSGTSSDHSTHPSDPAPPTATSASDSWRTTLSGRHELATPQSSRFVSPDSERGATARPSGWTNPRTAPAVAMDAPPVELPAYENERLLRRRPSSSPDRF